MNILQINMSRKLLNMNDLSAGNRGGYPPKGARKCTIHYA
jgi:hypothetical protein